MSHETAEAFTDIPNPFTEVYPEHHLADLNIPQDKKICQVCGGRTVIMYLCDSCPYLFCGKHIIKCDKCNDTMICEGCEWVHNKMNHEEEEKK